MNRMISSAALAFVITVLPAAAAEKAPRAATGGRYQLMTIKDQEGKEMLVRIDKETGATWVMRFGEYPPSPKGPVHYWLTVPCVRGDTLQKC